MKHFTLILSAFTVVSCRPQFQSVPVQGTPSTNVEIEKQQVVELNPDSKNIKLEESTKEILRKIAEVNERQGLNQRRKPFPFTNFMRQDFNRKDNEFKFPKEPFSNPILNYLENKNEDVDTRSSVPLIKGYVVNQEIPDEVPEGQYIKRKVVHQQTMMVPAQYYQQPPMYSAPQPQMELFNQYYQPTQTQNIDSDKSQADLESQTIDNIRNIVGTSMVPLAYNNGPYYGQPQFVNPQYFRPGRQWQWPFAQYFPIVIKDPLMHMFNAITSMVEYGPQASQNVCGTKPSKGKTTTEEEELKARENTKLSYHLTNNELLVNNGDQQANSGTYLDIEDLRITDDSANNPGVNFNVNFRDGKELVAPQPSEILKKHPLLQSIEVKQEPLQVLRKVPSPPTRDQVLHADELEDHLDIMDKAEDIHLNQDNNKKLFSKDNTGSGIFVHKIKVRKGGVAIAGPGGIATAGSGGTAIVGPNGVAYTQPNSLAIAGSGSKVIAVEPNVNLTELIGQHHQQQQQQQQQGGNKFQKGRPQRIGKVVAVGFNQDSTTPKVTILPFYGGGRGQSLQITENPDGTVFTAIIPTPTKRKPIEKPTLNPTELENPALPSKQEQDFGDSIRNIHNTALNIIKLQEIAKKNGRLNEDEEATYQRNMDSLNLSAQNLASIQEAAHDFDFETREGLSEWFERKKSNKTKDKKKEEEKKKKEEEEKKKKEEEERKKKEEEERIKKEEEEKKKKEEEEKKKKGQKEEEEEEEIIENEDDGIAINVPSDETSVAEAKPVGLAVAGEGGVAASKPVATAVVGPGGIAVARPVGTAIAGVSPDQALVPIYAEGYIGALKPKRSGSASTSKPDIASEYLNKIIHKYHHV